MRGIQKEKEKGKLRTRSGTWGNDKKTGNGKDKHWNEGWKDMKSGYRERWGETGVSCHIPVNISNVIIIIYLKIFLKVFASFG